MQPDDRQNDTWQQPTMQPNQAPLPARPQPEQPSAVSQQPTVQPVVAPMPAPLATSDQPLRTEPQQNPVDPNTVAATSLQGLPVDETTVHWQASEYIHRDKGFLWYVVFSIVVLALIALAILIMRAWTFAILILVMAAALIVYSRRPPRLLNYTLSRQGLHIDDKLFPFHDFKSFTIIHGDDEHSIMLVPVKRFRPGVTVYFPEESGEAIVDMLAARMPMQESKLDVIDQIIRKLRI